MKLMDKLKKFFGKSGKAPDSGNSKEQRQREAELVEKMQNPPVASYTNPNAPMTYQEMALLVPRDMWLPKHPKSFTVLWVRLLRNIHYAWQSMNQIWRLPTSWRATMSSRKEAPSNLEVLISEEVLPTGTTLDEAVEELTDELNCVECIALEQCADCFGEDTRDNENPRCREVVRAYLNQDYKKKEDK